MRYKKIASIIAIMGLLFMVLSNGLWARKAPKSKVERELQALKKELNLIKTTYQKRISTLEERINQLESEKQQKELDDLKKAALSEASDEYSIIKDTENAQEKTYAAKNLGLQAENPEISVTGDMLMYYRKQKGNREKYNSFFRNMAIHFKTYLGPDTYFKAAYPVVEGVGTPDLAEAYIVKSGITHNMNLMLGKFRQQFGVVNRWHKHALDYVDFPLPLRKIFGDGGLNQTGLSLDWQLSKPGARADQSLVCQVTKGKNGKVFAENSKGLPSFLFHYKNYKDLNKDAYFEWGWTGMWGRNDTWQDSTGAAHYKGRNTYLGGLDFTYFWEPTDKMRYKNFLWRSEFYYLNKGILRENDLAKDQLHAWGGYTNFQWKVNRTREFGFRVDYYEPDEKPYSWGEYAYNASNPKVWQFSPYITYYPYPWMHYRLEFDYVNPENTGEQIDRRIIFQCVWAAGPHQHDRY